MPGRAVSGKAGAVCGPGTVPPVAQSQSLDEQPPLLEGCPLCSRELAWRTVLVSSQARVSTSGSGIAWSARGTGLATSYVLPSRGSVSTHHPGAPSGETGEGVAQDQSPGLIAGEVVTLPGGALSPTSFSCCHPHLAGALEQGASVVA